MKIRTSRPALAYENNNSNTARTESRCVLQFVYFAAATFKIDDDKNSGARGASVGKVVVLL